MQVECRKRLAAGNDLDLRELRQQRLQLGLHLADDIGAAARQQRRVANELDGVAEALLGMQQNGLAGNRLSRRATAAPIWPPVPGEGVGFPAPFIFLPARREIAERKSASSPASKWASANCGAAASAALKSASASTGRSSRRRAWPRLVRICGWPGISDERVSHSSRSPRPAGSVAAARLPRLTRAPTWVGSFASTPS